jgi:hypothetical protein
MLFAVCKLLFASSYGKMLAADKFPTWCSGFVFVVLAVCHHHLWHLRNGKQYQKNLGLYKQDIISVSFLNSVCFFPLSYARSIYV